jgi:hypothetical protein
VDDELLYDVDSMMSAHEVRRTRARVQDANAYIRRHGFPTIGRVPWGYKLRDATPEERALGSGHKMIEPHEVEAPYVVQAFERRAAGESMNRIREWAMTLPAEALGGRSMPWQTFRDRFKAPVYVARHDQPADVPVLLRPVGRWQPLVSDEVFERVGREAEKHRKMPKQASGAYLLTGLMRCPKCGTRMGGKPYSGANGKPAYRCEARTYGRWTRENTGSGCLYSVPAHLVEPIVTDLVASILASVKSPRVLAAVEAGWEEIRAREAAGDDTPRRIAATEARLAKWRRAAADAYADLRAGDLSRDEYQAIRVTAAGEVGVAERELERLRAAYHAEDAIPSWSEVKATLDELVPLFEAAETSRRRAALADLLERVVPHRQGYGKYKVEPSWTALGKRLLAVTAAARGDPQMCHVYEFGQPNGSASSARR